ncbi:hypothetical protein N7456_003073 [Penicillium angulare]|uniref:EKC/KEOPS complex subunit BUD32 n=1 Tax=Penicillium angulare TaxID=116970 RepID=A0A9W9FU30_9EURO|nr:hypothetical protein N7456_003073 [Penicillium angulare]
MINPKDRFFSEGQGYFGPRDNPLTETHCNVWDWDQLRTIKVKGTAKLFLPDEDVEVPILARLADYLSPEVRAITVDDDGLLTAISTDPKEDDTLFFAYLPFEIVKPLVPPESNTIKHFQLQELDRLGPGVDLVSYKDDSGVLHKVAFKFNPIWKPLRLQMAWNELNLLSRLPAHPNIVPFDRIVLDSIESRVLGFTTRYFPDGTLENREMPLRLEWFRQLTQVVDFLNLELGIIHGDIAPRNLLIDLEADTIRLFDFDWAVCTAGKESSTKGRDDVTGVAFALYELITYDTRLTNIPHWDRDIDMAQNIEWPCNRELDHEVSTFRDFLNEWVAKRRSDGENRSLNAPKQITWPDIPTAPDYSVPVQIGTLDGEPAWRTGARSRYTALKDGQYVFNWERPPQSRLLAKTEKPL